MSSKTGLLDEGDALLGDFCVELLDGCNVLTREGLLKAREFNFQRYHFQGIGRYAPNAGTN
jgi:hypothetical protein